MVQTQVSVRLVEWNVAMSLQNKAHLLTQLNPTIAVLPEAAHPDKTRSALAAVGAHSVQWIGDNPNKGLLVAAFGDWTVEIDESYDAGYQWVMPVHVQGPAHIRMLAVWDMNHRGSGHEEARRKGACRASMEHYADFLGGPCDLSVIAGDFNNSVYWDKGKSTIKFGDFMDQLDRRGFASAYHAHHRCARGKEPQPTLWWTRNVAKSYHVDYAFVSPPGAIENVDLGSAEHWLAHSDHSPMTIDLRVTCRRMSAPAVAVPDAPSGGVPKHVVVQEHNSFRPVESRGEGQVRFDLEPGAVPQR